MEYIFKTLFVYEEDRLPNYLSKRIVDKKLYWFKDWCDKENEMFVAWSDVPLEKPRWQNCVKASIENMKIYQKNQQLQKQRDTQKFYNKLTPAAGEYCHGNLSSTEITWTMKARCDMIGLNVNKFEQNADKRCSMCN